MKLDHEEVWRHCLDFIQKAIDPMAYQTWFEPIVPLKLEQVVLTIQVPSLYFYEIIEEQYIDHLRAALRKYVGEQARLEYSVVMEKRMKELVQKSYADTVTGRTAIGAFCEPADI